MCVLHKSVGFAKLVPKRGATGPLLGALKSFRLDRNPLVLSLQDK